MKALSLWQCWATLIAIGAKQFETRSWATPYRGPLVIHAAKRFQIEEYKLALSEPFRTALGNAGLHAAELPLGCALCVVDLVDVVRVETVRGQIGHNERCFGNYADGRWAWKLANVRVFPEPIAMRGMQGLFDCPLNAEVLRGIGM